MEITAKSLGLPVSRFAESPRVAALRACPTASFADLSALAGEIESGLSPGLIRLAVLRLGASASDVGAVIAEARALADFIGGPGDIRPSVTYTPAELLGSHRGRPIVSLARAALAGNAPLGEYLRWLGIRPTPQGIDVWYGRRGAGYSCAASVALGSAWVAALLAVPGSRRGKGAVRPGSRNDVFVRLPWAAFPPESPVAESPATESPVAESPVAESPVAESLAESAA